MGASREAVECPNLILNSAKHGGHQGCPSWGGRLNLKLRLGSADPRQNGGPPGLTMPSLIPDGHCKGVALPSPAQQGTHWLFPLGTAEHRLAGAAGSRSGFDPVPSSSQRAPRASAHKQVLEMESEQRKIQDSQSTKLLAVRSFVTS